MSTLTVIGTRVHDVQCNVSGEVDLSLISAQGDENRNRVISLGRACNAGIARIEILADGKDVPVVVTPDNQKTWTAQFGDESHTFNRSEARKNKDVPMSDSNRNFGADIGVVLTAVLQKWFPEIKPARGSGASKTRATNKVLKSQLETLQAALEKTGSFTEEQIAEMLQNAADDASQNQARKDAHKESGKVTASDVPSKK